MNQPLRKLLTKIYKEKFPQMDFVPGKSVIPVSGKVFDENEIINMTEAVLEGWWTEGSWSQKFEQGLAKYVGVRFCSAVNSGSSANLIAFAALTSHLLKDRRIKAGDEVITVATSFPTTVNPIIQYGCVPVFLDLDLETMEIDVSQLEKAYSSKVKAVFIAHTLGNTFNIQVIKKFCDAYKIWLIEDNCDALGSTYDGKKTGSFGDISTLSFYPAHHITTAEGGAVLTNNVLLHKIIRSFRDWGRDCWCPTGKDDTCGVRFNWQLGMLPHGYDHKYIYSHAGFNVKMTDIQAALGVAQLKKLGKFTEKRKSNYRKMMKALRSFGEYFYFVQPTEKSDPSWFGFILTIKKSAPFDRNEFLKYLNSKKIDTRLLFAGNIIKQPYFVENNIAYRTVGDLGNSDIVMNRTFWIGVYPKINDAMIAYIAESFGEFLSRFAQ